MSIRKILPTLTAAHEAGAGTDKGATTRLLEALDKNERDSDLATLAHAILYGGDYYTRNAEDMEMAYEHAETIRRMAENIATEYEGVAEDCKTRPEE